MDYFDFDPISDIARELGVDYECGSDVYYLRSRNRWTPELESELIRLHKQENPPNIYDFGVTPETQKAMENEITKVIERLEDGAI